MPDNNTIIIRSHDWHGFAAPGWEDVANPEALANAGTEIVRKPDRMLRRITTPHGTIYVKWLFPLRGGTLFARIVRTIKRLIREPRVFTIWTVHHQLKAEGLGCPKPLFALKGRNGVQLFAAEALTLPTLAQCLSSAADITEKEELLRIAAEAIRRLHDASFVHGDCLPGNFCIDDDGNPFFLDNDRTARRPPILLKRGINANIVQFCSRACKFFPSETFVDVFLDAYFAHERQLTPREIAAIRLKLRQTIAARIIVLQHERDAARAQEYKP